MRIAEVDRDPSVDPQAGVLRHLGSLIPGQRPAELHGSVAIVRNGVADRLGTMPGQRGPVLHANARAVACHARQVEQEREPRGALHQRADGRIAQPQDEILCLLLIPSASATLNGRPA